jgi:hypothetical protein
MRPHRRATSLRIRAKGTNTGPFDGSALTHGWTRASAKGPTAAHRPTSSPGRHGHSLDLAPCGAREEGEEEKEKEMKRGASAAACRLALLTVNRWRAHLPSDAAAHVMESKGKEKQRREGSEPQPCARGTPRRRRRARRTGAPPAAAIVRARDLGKGKEMVLGLQGVSVAAGFCSAEERARPSIAMDGQRRPAGAGLD